MRGDRGSGVYFFSVTTAEPFLPLRTTLLSFPPRAEAFLYVLRKKLWRACGRGRETRSAVWSTEQSRGRYKGTECKDRPDEEEEVGRDEKAAEDGGRLGAGAVADLGERERHVGRGKVGVACVRVKPGSRG